jgi:hypothetical protein
VVSELSVKAFLQNGANQSEDSLLKELCEFFLGIDMEDQLLFDVTDDFLLSTNSIVKEKIKEKNEEKRLRETEPKEDCETPKDEFSSFFHHDGPYTFNEREDAFGRRELDSYIKQNYKNSLIEKLQVVDSKLQDAYDFPFSVAFRKEVFNMTDVVAPFQKTINSMLKSEVNEFKLLYDVVYDQATYDVDAFKEMFPNEDYDLEVGIEEVLRILNNKVDRQMATSILVGSTSICHSTSKYNEFSRERLEMHLALDHLKYFDDKALKEFYAFLLDAHNKATMPLYSQWQKMDIFDKSQACSTDEIPNAVGEFGLCSSNPVPVYCIHSNDIYLSRLRTLDGGRIYWNRYGSMGDEHIKNQIDKYEIFNASEEFITHIFISPYHLRTSMKAPKGFMTI